MEQCRGHRGRRRARIVGEQGGMGITFFQFRNLPAGYYEVYNYMQWGPGAASAQAWSRYGSSPQYYACVFSS